MNRLRRLAHDYLLPLVIGALVLRALIPVGFMPVGAGMQLTAALCNAAATGNPGTEIIDLDDRGSGTALHCDFCVLPVMAAGCPPPALAPSAAISTKVARLLPAPPVSRFALERAQIPRAPPLA